MKLAPQIIFSTFLLMSMLTSSLFAQKVTISSDIILHDDSRYSLLGEIDNNILLFRNKTLSQELHIYNKDLEYKRTVDITLEEKRENLITVTTNPYDFNIFYSYKYEDTEYIKVKKFGGDGQPLIVDTVYHKSNPSVSSYYKSTSSENQRYTAIFRSPNDDTFFLTVYDGQEMKTIYDQSIKLEGINFKNNFRKIIITNKGFVNLLFEKFNYKNRLDEHHFRFITLNQQGILEQKKIPLLNLFSIDVKLIADNVNDEVIIAGLYGDDLNYISNGYFRTVKGEIITHPYTSDTDNAMINKGTSIKNGLEYYRLTDVILRNDGGFLLCLELNREYFRSTTRPQDALGRYRTGSVDYYAEDIFLINAMPDGEPAWKVVLPKRQISQNDNGMYSSYFLFMTPSKLHFIFNDEIKNNNTVSEYVVNPIGVFERNALLSTAYQKIRLRIKSAKQTSASTFLLISEKSNKLNIVEVKYQ